MSILKRIKRWVIEKWSRLFTLDGVVMAERIHVEFENYMKDREELARARYPYLFSNASIEEYPEEFTAKHFDKEDRFPVVDVIPCSCKPRVWDRGYVSPSTHLWKCRTCKFLKRTNLLDSPWCNQNKLGWSLDKVESA